MIEILLGEFYEKLKILKSSVLRQAQFPEAPNKIKVAIGMRRAGKTYFLFQYIQKLLNEGVPRSTILYVNFEDDRLIPLNQAKLASLVESFYSLFPENHDKKCYLFLDEIQNVEDWPTVIRRLHDSKNVEIFLTGSSAKLLSKEIASSLRGRSLATEIWPYSFSEFITAKNYSIDSSLFDKKTKDTLSKLFQEYLSIGGFPEVNSYHSDFRQQTLQEYIDIALFRDIIERHKISNPSAIKYMILSMIHNIGSPFAIHKFYNDLKSQGYSIGKDILYDYASYIEDCYLAFSVPLYNPSLRVVQTNPKKIYAIDPGLVRASTLAYEGELGRLFENVVYLDLRRRGYQVSYYLTAERYEVDFLIQSPRGEKKLIQVAWDMESPKTADREQRALKAGMEELGVDGTIVTLDSYLRQGI